MNSQVLIPALVAFSVVGLTHLFTSYRDRRNRRQEQRISYLVNAFRAFAKTVHHPRLYQVGQELEQAVADVQLFGTPEQVRLVQKFATELGTTQTADMDDLMNDLRNSLRSELGAKPVDGRYVWLRIGDKKEADEHHPDSL